MSKKYCFYIVSQFFSKRYNYIVTNNISREHTGRSGLINRPGRKEKTLLIDIKDGRKLIDKARPGKGHTHGKFDFGPDGCFVVQSKKHDQVIQCCFYPWNRVEVEYYRMEGDEAILLEKEIIPFKKKAAPSTYTDLLHGYKNCIERIARIHDSLVDTESILNETLAHLEAHPTECNLAKAAKMREEIDRLHQSIADEAAVLTESYSQVCDVINRIPDPVVREFMINYYSTSATLESMAECKKYGGLSTVKKLHAKGKEYVYKMMSKS